MSWINHDDVLDQLRAAGLIIKDGALQVGTSRPVRCHVDGDREKRGWYKLFELTLGDGRTLITGSFGVWQGDDNGAKKVLLPKTERKALDADQLAAIKARQAEDRKRAEAERQHEIDRAAARASRWWAQCGEAGASGYLTRKGLPPGKLYGARISASGNLVVPILDGDGRIYGLQVIYDKPVAKGSGKPRDKDYTPPGLAKQGHWAEIGAPRAGRIILLVEGFATGASLHEATGLPVIVAFDAGNLLPVAQHIVKRYRRARILVCADDDYLAKCADCGKLTPVAAQACAHCGADHGKTNTGAMRAEAAAVAVSGTWVLPQWPSERPTDRKGPTDFNDLHTHPQGGLHVVRAQIDAALASAGWAAAEPLERASPQNGGAGDAGESRPEAVSILPLEQVVDRFIAVDDDTGEYVFDTWTRSLCRLAKVLRMLPARVRGDDVKDHPTWKSRAVYIDQIGFDPGAEDPNIRCNLWGGWPTRPKYGSCDNLLALLEHICSGESSSEQLYMWVLQWLAYPIQHPGAKMASAIVVHGPQGTGKSRFFEAVAKIYGEYGIVLNQGAIEDKFNADWVSRKLFVLADEIVANTEKYHLKNLLKTFITGETIRVNPKFMAAHTERNHMNLVFLSNEKQPVVLEGDDRRHCVIWTPPKLDPRFYAAIDEEIESGGIAALHHFLLHVDLTDFKPWTWPPMTVAKRELIDVSANSEERFAAEWMLGNICFDDEAGPLPICPAGTQQVYDAYLRWCKLQGEPRPRPQNQFIGHLTKRQGWTAEHRDRFENLHFMGDRKRQRMVLPSARDIAEAAARGAPTVPHDPAETLAQWSTRCFFAFRNAAQARP